MADLGMLIARTDPDQPKHAGITYFVIDMHQPGVDVRPLREMTGRALFNEVFLEDARVRDDDDDRRPQQRLAGGQHHAHVRAVEPRRRRRLGGGVARQPGHRRRRPRPAGRRLRVAAAVGAAAGGGTLFGASSKALVEDRPGQRQGARTRRSARS